MATSLDPPKFPSAKDVGMKFMVWKDGRFEYRDPEDVRSMTMDCPVSHFEVVGLSLGVSPA